MIAFVVIVPYGSHNLGPLHRGVVSSPTDQVFKRRHMLASGKPQICLFCFSKQNKRNKRGNYEIIKQDPRRSSAKSMKSSVQFS